MSNKWYKDVPEQGILVKQTLGEIELISCLSNVLHLEHDDGKTKECYGVDILGDDIAPISELEPISVQEWWKFAPWQSMNEAPFYEPIIVYDDKINLVFLYEDNQRDWYEKWLPLPKDLK